MNHEDLIDDWACMDKAQQWRQRAEAAEAKVALADAYGRYCAHVTLQSGARAILKFEDWLRSRR